MEGQYYIVALFVVVIVVWQFFAYVRNVQRINRLNNLFSKNEFNTLLNEEGVVSIQNNLASEDYKTTLKDVNSYLAKNKNKASDYHIIKEIVERNAHSVEEEIDTMLSTPLYLGLMATIIGIAFGVIFFAIEDLPNLLSGDEIEVNGIRTLLTDVGIAMIASFVGVLATKMSTSKYNDARRNMLSQKNVFLTWIQTELMPNLNDDLTGALVKMTQDLNNFNNTFAENTRELHETLQLVTDNYENQVELLETIDKLKINKIASANIEVYDKLKGCSDEIGKLFNHLEQSERYITKVVELNEKLGSIEERTKLSEELGRYFRDEIEYVKDRQGQMRMTMSQLDSVIAEALSNLGTSVNANVQELTVVFQRQNQSVQQLIEEQQNALAESLANQQLLINQKLSDMEDPFKPVKDAFADMANQAKDGLVSIQNVFAEQNEMIREMFMRQNQMFEEALMQQREAIHKKFAEMPTQMNVLYDIVRTLESINANVSSSYSQDELIQAIRGNKSIVKKGKWKYLDKVMPYAVPALLGGTFVALVILIVITCLK